MLDIGLVTCEKLPLLDPDSQLLETKLKEMGLKVAPVIWTDPAVAWDKMKLCLVRSTWDYHQKLSEFMIWAKRVALKTQLWNPIEIIMPNTNKTYLKSLSNQGIRIVETVWVNPHDRFNLPDMMNEKGWDEVVVKPTISACSLDTFRVNRDNLDALWPEIQALLPYKAFMIQPYLHKIETEGEVSLIYINRRLTHAVSKKPKSGDFRVQEEWGGM
ncbi:MAG: hypothetical protein K2X66_08650, partial [Cyanobacteria bacterium]|nr:hypothetical protein [Cyanobacteriota bacterium]